MSDIDSLGTNVSEDTVALIESLDDLAVSGSNEFIQKSSSTTVINTTGGATFSVEEPTGAVNASNTNFTFVNKPTLVVVNGGIYRENKGWTWSSPIATIAFPAGVNGDVYGVM